MIKNELLLSGLSLAQIAMVTRELRKLKIRKPKIVVMNIKTK